jgi:glutamate/tyrosine decarboxylase-like PLP-dependent enzyme
MVQDTPQQAVRRAMPDHGRQSANVFHELFERKMADADWQHGRTFNLVYPTGRSDVDAVLAEANNAYLYENALNPLRFPSLGSMQREVLDMVTSLVKAPSRAGAGFSSGGTESILLSVLVSRERARVEKGVAQGNIVFPTSAHPAFAKAAFYLGLEARHTALSADFTADVTALREAVDENTVMIVGSAYNFPYGVMDPIEQLSNLALERSIPFHSDTCIGAFVLPFMERLGIAIPPFDFRLPGVTQMSCDIHKYGYVTKGASVVVYRDEDWLRHQIFDYDVWPIGRYRNASVAGARAASPVAAAWSLMNYLGLDGYTEIMRGLLATTERFRVGITALGGLEIMGEPVGPLLSFTSVTEDIFAIADVMDDRGWHLNRVHDPSGVQMMLAPLHGQIVDEFLSDLAWAVANHGVSRGALNGYN